MKRAALVLVAAVLGVAIVCASCLAYSWVALCLDPNGQGDLSFNDMARTGVKQACEDFDWQQVVYSTGTLSDRLTQAVTATQHPYDLIICVGGLYGFDLAQIAPQYPNKRFAIIDNAGVTGPNILNVAFRENEVCALIGALGALLATTRGYPALGSVFCPQVNTIYPYEAGLRFGVEWGSAMATALSSSTQGIQLLWNYSSLPCNSPGALGLLAQSQLNQGAVGVFNVAGIFGSTDIYPVIAAAHASMTVPTDYGPPYYFGIDWAEDYKGLGHFGLASAVKRVDHACYHAVQAVEKGTFTGGGSGAGQVLRLGLDDGGIGLSDLGDLLRTCQFASLNVFDTSTTMAWWGINRIDVPHWIWDAVDALRKGIESGQIAVPTATNTAQITSIRSLYSTPPGPLPSAAASSFSTLGAAYRAAFGSGTITLTDLAVQIANALPY